MGVTIMLTIRVLLLLVSVLGGWQQVSCGSSDDYYTYTQKLFADINSHNINKDVLPQVDVNSAIEVGVKLTVNTFDYNDAKQEFTTNGWFHMEWNDRRFAWSPEEYGNVSNIRMGPGNIWMPDITLYNSATGHDHAKNAASPTKSLIYSNGKIIFVPIVTFVTSCEANLINWPYDTMKCTVKIGSWTHPQNEIEMKLIDTGIDMSNLNEGNWKMLSSSTKLESKLYDCCSELYQSATYTFEIQRQSGPRWATIITPAFAIAVLSLLICFIPPMSSSKLLVGVVQLLLISGQLIYLDSVFAGADGPTPMIVIYYGIVLVLASLSLAASVLTFSWMSFPKSSPPPESVTKFLGGGFGSCLGVQPQVFGYQLRDGEKNCESDPRSTVQKQWLSLSCAIHRFFSFVYYLYFLVALSIFLTV